MTKRHALSSPKTFQLHFEIRQFIWNFQLLSQCAGVAGKVSRWFQLKQKPNVTITSSVGCYSLFHRHEVPVASRVASLLLQVFKLTFLEYLSPFLKVWCSVLWMLTWHQPLCPPEGIKWIIHGSGCLPWTSHLTRSLVFWRQFNFFVKIIASCKGRWIRLLGSYVPRPRHHTYQESLPWFAPANVLRAASAMQSGTR